MIKEVLRKAIAGADTVQGDLNGKIQIRCQRSRCIRGKMFWSPFIGALEGVKAAANRPKATSWKEFIVNDIRLYFAPLTGAIGGVVNALKGSHKNER